MANGEEVLKNTLGYAILLGDFSHFRDIDIFKTGLIEKTPEVESFFKKRKIKNLADLFEKDYKGLLQLSDNNELERKIKGFLTIAQCKYLDYDLGFETNPYVKHNHSYWFYTVESEYALRRLSLDEIGAVREVVLVQFSGLGFDISPLIKLGSLVLGEEFSFVDVFTNDIIIEKVRTSSEKEVVKNSIYVISKHYKKRLEPPKFDIKEIATLVKSSDNKTATTTVLEMLLLEEKMLIRKLVELNERSLELDAKTAEFAVLNSQSSNLTKRLVEIQQRKSNYSKKWGHEL